MVSWTRVRTRAFAGASASDDPFRCRVAPAAPRSWDRLERDRVPERPGERLKRCEELGVRVSGQRVAWRFQRRGVRAGQRLGLGDVEHERGLEQDAWLDLLDCGHRVAVLHRDRCHDPDRGLAVANGPSQLEPGAEPGDPLRLDSALIALKGDQHAVGRRIRVEAGADAHPARPALGTQQLLGRVLQPLAIGASALIAFLLGHATP
jgi:hypothetical protein